MSPRPGAGRLRRGALAVLRLCAITGVTLLIPEGLVRLLSPQVLPRDIPELWEVHPELGWRHAPEARVLANTGERDVEVCTDAVGDRVDCQRPERGPCAARVLVIGDSMVEALAIPWRQTAWSQLEEDTGACLFVSGVGGYGLAQYAEVARRRLGETPGYDAALLVFYVGNDFTLDATLMPKPQEVQRKPLRLLPAEWSPRGVRDWFYPYNAWLESRSHAYVALRAAVRRLQDPGRVGQFGVPLCVQPSRLGEAMLDETTRGVRGVAERAARAGTPLGVVLVPHWSQVLDPGGERLLQGLPHLAGDVDMDLVRRRFVPRLEAIPEVAEVVDLLPLLRERAGPSAWGERDPHPSPEQHALWREALRAPLRRLLSGRSP